uniref:Uncharacterized protein n=1 Tax=Brassica oleracea var. oleracea TaxID=109376 RepID=A0A0D3EDE2_BRAOL
MFVSEMRSQKGCTFDHKTEIGERTWSASGNPQARRPRVGHWWAILSPCYRAPSD